MPELIYDGISGFLTTVIGFLFELSDSELSKTTQAAREKITADHGIENLTMDLYFSLLKLIVNEQGGVILCE